jgi:HEAT repeat protein
MRHLLVVGCILAGCTLSQAQGTDPTVKLVKQLNSKKSETRVAALAALGELGPKAEPAIPAIVKFLPTIDDEERILAALSGPRLSLRSRPS